MMQPETKILIAEDDPNSARLISDYFTAKGAQITWKVDGNEALEAAQAGHYDLLILDLRLPGKNGFVVAREIRNDERLFYLPIIVTSAFPDEQNLLRSYQLGVDLFLSKPVDLKRLFLRAKNLTVRHKKAERKIIEALYRLNDLIENKLNRAGHAARVKNNCLALAATYNLKKYLASMKTAALLHDLGLVFTEKIPEHGPIGAKIVRMFGVKEEVAYLIEKHHEEISPAVKLNPEETLENYLQILKLAEKIEECYQDSFSFFKEDQEDGLFAPEVVSVITELIR